MKPKGITKENRRFVQGAMIINAPSAALNLGQNGIKRMSTKGEDGNRVTFSYLSGQFIKSKIKETLIENGEKLSMPEIIQEAAKRNTPTTSCNPFEYMDDDLFGYMNVIKSEQHKNPGTTRIAPFKISYFLGKEGDYKKDFAVKQNGALKDDKLTTMPLDDDNRYFASTSYSGCFSLDVNMVGRFFKGSTAGFMNLSEKFPQDDYQDIIHDSDEYETVLNQDVRSDRIQKLLKTLPYLSGGARRSTVYADLSPKFVIYCVTDSGNHLFQEIASIYSHFNVKALMEGVNDFSNNIKSNIYISLKNGFLDNKRNEILQAVKKYNTTSENIKFIFNNDLSGVNDITNRFANDIIPGLFEINNI
jgi:CRISPR-associated protein Cst2